MGFCGWEIFCRTHVPNAAVCLRIDRTTGATLNGGYCAYFIVCLIGAMFALTGFMEELMQPTATGAARDVLDRAWQKNVLTRPDFQPRLHQAMTA